MFMAAKFNTGTGKRLFQPRFSVVLVLQLFLASVILVSIGIAVFRYQQTVFVMAEPKNHQQQESKLVDSALAKDGQPLSFYQDLINQRDIFHFKSAAVEPVGMVGEVIPAADSNFALRYIVQGIVIDQNSQAIIKDMQSAKTHFVHRNEKLDGATLIDIQGNRLTFNLNGKTFELIKK